ncbi:MAG: cysteine synthase A [Faecalibacterium sp.]|jgi:cysteine synthase A|nr:cysteine synthase A [Faecalibacterium sp.]
MLYSSVTELVGHTPLLELCRYEAKHSLNARIALKLESRNPAGSAKDRVGLSMLNDAERTGRLAPGGTVIEATSGNTGIGLASACAARGYRLIITMPDSMSAERRRLLAAYGAELVLTPAAEGMAGSVKKAEALQKQTPNSILAGQFINPANPAAHYATTGPEIWADTEGKVDIFVAGIGTGGTLTGVGRYLKERNPAVRIVGVEPAGDPLLTKGVAGPHKIQGIGANFIPDVLDRRIYDEILDIENDDAYAAARALGPTEGVLIGISAGAALYAATLLAKRPENAGKLIVALAPDGGDHYLSTDLYPQV